MAASKSQRGGATFCGCDAASRSHAPVVRRMKPSRSETTGVGGAANPIEIITYDVVATGVGSVPVRALISGMVNKNRLIIHGTSDAASTAVIEALRDFTIVAHPVRQLAGLDNQPS